MLPEQMLIVSRPRADSISTRFVLLTCYLTTYLHLRLEVLQQPVPLTSGDGAVPRQRHVLGVRPRHSLHWRVQPERLSDAHGGEGKVGQVLPLERYAIMHVHYLSENFKAFVSQ